MSAVTETSVTNSGSQIAVTPGQWTVSHFPSTATQATASKAAGGAGVYHVCTGISATVAANGTAQTPLRLNLRDGATGAGTVLLNLALSAPVTSAGVISLSGLNIVGSANTAMTLEFSAAGVTASQSAVTLVGYSVTT